jgi:hypothetical protein
MVFFMFASMRAIAKCLQRNDMSSNWQSGGRRFDPVRLHQVHKLRQVRPFLPSRGSRDPRRHRATPAESGGRVEQRPSHGLADGRWERGPPCARREPWRRPPSFRLTGSGQRAPIAPAPAFRRSPLPSASTRCASDRGAGGRATIGRSAIGRLTIARATLARATTARATLAAVTVARAAIRCSVSRRIRLAAVSVPRPHSS